MGDGDQLLDQLMRFKPEELTANGWAVKAGVSRTIWADLKRHGNPSRRTLERLLGAAGSTLAEFEALRVGRHLPGDGGTTVPGVADGLGLGWRRGPSMPVPLVETRLAGEWGEKGSNIELAELLPDRLRGHVPRPPSMGGDRDAYAITVLGDAMWPRFRPGRQLLVSPAAPVAIGDDVVVRLADTAEDGAVPILVKEIIRRTAAFIELRQYNPDLSFRVDAALIAAVHKVMGEAI